MKHWLVRLLVWLDVSVLKCRWDWFCNWTWDLEIEDDAKSGKLGLLSDKQHYHE